MTGLTQDIRFALRGLRRNPGFTLVAVVLLALGIGTNTVMFSVVDAVVLRPLPFAHPDELLVIGRGSAPGRPFRGSASWPVFRDWREQSRSIRDMAAYHGVSMVLTGSGPPELLEAIASTANLFDLLGVAAAQGRTFAAGEDQPGRNRVVVLSDRLWRQRFGADPGIVGRSLSLGGSSYSVIGVAPPTFQFPPSEHAGALWVPVPYGALDEVAPTRDLSHLQVVGRLAEGATLAGARAELQTIQARLAALHPEDRGAALLTAVPLQEDLIRSVKGSMWMLLVAVACLLLIGCANVASLLMARATVRSRELALRAVLGAGRGRMVRQLLTEGALLGFIGATAGMLLAVWGLEVVLGLLPASLPRPHAIAMDGRVLAFTVVLAVATTLAFGVVPALGASRADPGTVLKLAGRFISQGRERGRAVMLVAEIALSFLLLVGAGLALRSLARLNAVDPGFDPRNLLTVDIRLPDTVYQPEQTRTFYRELMPRLRELPSATHVAMVLPVPYSRSNINPPFTIVGRPPPVQGRLSSPARFVSPGYFDLMGMPLLRGRLLQPSDDRESAQPVVVVSESFARQYFAGEPALGKRIDLGGVREIVGIVADVKPRLDAPSRPEVYMPFARPFVDIPLRSRTVLVRGPQPRSLLGPLRAAVESLDHNLPLGEIKTMDERLVESTQQRRLNAILLTLFAVLGVVLAAAGMYGVMSYNVSQRTRELGVRMALGAEQRRVLRMIVGQGLRLALLGLTLGLVGAMGATRLIASQLYGISPTDPGTYAALAVLLLAVAALASLLPALRATRVDPMVALRAE